MKHPDPRRTLISPHRRWLLKTVGAALGASWVTPAMRLAGIETTLGKAYAQQMGDSKPINFIEINLRDQWDFGHCFVPPGIATETQPIIRGEKGRKLPLFFRNEQIVDHGNGFFLTPSSTSLVPHLDNIAVVETCELSVGRILSLIHI